MKISPKKTVILGVLLTLGILGGCGQASQNEVSTTPETTTTSETTTTETATASVGVSSFIYKDGDVAIKGTDPVAYFTDSQAVEGSAEFAYEWNGAKWHFASAENRDLFSADPEKYAPQYGGHCAWAAAQGNVAPIDPTAWSIVDGKLYLNFNDKIQARWEKDIPGFIADADAKWPGIVEQNS
ncbi:YHS domain-containing protein [[Leptolyngbya] sp. PCC 7376]|uniref:YHS domain-containing (seleno)protein n=1 Tax=[Leptolyngbya] sp. PCC 7376 TaxID=111781 RepID=UPI00029F3062|nr:YHS domain-containing (seleno)protein [[Leptolyngbya] sp. PCC 7376]AFY38172.1 YHS domain-containing protein [[Leptolyngbya] sp. PCC 7376]